MNTLDHVAKAGYGLMSFTWIPSRKFTQEEFNSTLKEVLDGSKASPERQLFLNGGEFYGVPERHEGLRLIGSFFESNPTYADSVYLSIKAGTTPAWAPDTSPENLGKAIEAIDKYLQPLYKARKIHPPKLDMFTVARVGEEPIESVVLDLQQYIKSNKISSLCLSEVSAATLSRALSVARIDAVEVEFSLFHREGLENGVFDVCVKHNVPVVCYSPLGKGLLVGQTPESLSEDDMRNHFDKFNDPEVFKHNRLLVNKVGEIAKQLNLTPAQIALSWITSLSKTTHSGVTYPTMIPIPGSANAQRQLNNLDVVTLKESVLSEIDGILSTFKTAGYRYNKQLDASGYK